MSLGPLNQEMSAIWEQHQQCWAVADIALPIKLDKAKRYDFTRV